MLDLISCILYYVWIRDYYMTFSILDLVLARDSHIKPDSEAGGLIWVEGWYQGPYGKFHVIIFSSHIIHWPFPNNDFYIAKKIYEQTNSENKSLRELSLFNLQIFLFRIWFQKYTKQCRSVQWLSVKSTQDVDIWTEMTVCTITVCKIYTRRWHLNGNSYSTRRIYFS